MLFLKTGRASSVYLIGKHWGLVSLRFRVVKGCRCENLAMFSTISIFENTKFNICMYNYIENWHTREAGGRVAFRALGTQSEARVGSASCLCNLPHKQKNVIVKLIITLLFINKYLEQGFLSFWKASSSNYFVTIFETIITDTASHQLLPHYPVLLGSLKLLLCYI